MKTTIPGKAVQETLGVTAESLEALASGIENIAAACKVFSSSRLKRKTVIALLSRSSGVGQREVDAVLTSAETLAKDCLK